MLDRPRRTLISWASVSLGLFALLAYGATHGRRPLGPVDRLGRVAEDWADGHPALGPVLLWVEAAFETVPMSVIGAVLVLLLVWRGHPRAGLYAGFVMLTTALATTVVKELLGRSRPVWQRSADLLDSASFPSGHASSMTALMIVAAVLVTMLVRRSAWRRWAYAGCVLMVLLIWADRLLLGRHYPTDVVAGSLVATTVALGGLALLDPVPRTRPDREVPLTDSVPAVTRRLAVVLNPVKVEDVGQFRSLVTAMAAESGWEAPSWHYTTVEDPGTGMAHDAAVAGADLVVVCGGDGTVREVCAELAGTGIPVGIVPAGTGNLLARNLDIPLYLRSAVDVALNGQDRAIDLVEVSGDEIEDTHFMVMAGMGFDAAMMEGVNEEFKRKVGWFAYVWSGLKSLMFPAEKVEITVDGGEPAVHRARTVVVGNVGYLQAGMPLLPDAAIDDGLLDVVVLHPKSFLAWIPLAARVLSKRRRTDETINRLTGQTVTLRAAHATPRQLDGDSIGPGRELTMRCIHGRLLVRAPR